MSGVLIVAAYGALIWQAGWWGVVGVVAHVGIQLVAVRLGGGMGRSK